MRPPQKSNRARGRGNRKGGGGGNNINRVYESAGPEGKVRGTPQQIVDKYLSLARDAQTSGDRVTAENFLQHAEHYQRILMQASGAYEERREGQSSEQDDDDDMPAGGDYARFERVPQHEAPQQQSARPPSVAPEEPVESDARNAAPVNGLTTIDTADDGAPDLLVATTEMDASQPRRRRSPRTPRRAPAEGGEARPENAETRADQGKDPAEAD